MARRPLPMIMCEEHEGVNSRVHFYDHAIRYVDQYPKQNVAVPISMNPGFGRGHTFAHEVMAPELRRGFYESMYESNGSIFHEDWKGPTSGIIVEGRMRPVNRRVLVGEEYLLADKLTPLEYREYKREERYKIAENLERLCIKVNPDVFEEASGVCNNCGNITTQCCQRCSVWYCSRECQIQDWPQHRVECISAQELSKDPNSQIQTKTKEMLSVQEYEKRIEVNESNSTQASSNSQQHAASAMLNTTLQFQERNRHNEHNYTGNIKQNVAQKCNENKRQKQHTLKTHFPTKKHESQIEYKQQNNYVTCNKFSVNRNNHNFYKRDQIFNKGNNHKGRNLNTSQNVNQNNNNDNSKTACSQVLASDGNFVSSSSDVNKSTVNDYCKHENAAMKKNVDSGTNFSRFKEEITCKENSDKIPHDLTVNRHEISSGNYRSKSIELPQGKFSKVNVTVSLGKMQYWVQLENSTDLQKIMRVLNEDSEKTALRSIEQGMMCAALYSDLWYRGRVIQVEPVIKVLYIDYGNEKCCTHDQLKSIHDSAKNIPALAVKIKFAEGTSKQYESLAEGYALSVKPIGESGDVIIVQVEGEIYSDKGNEIDKNTLKLNSIENARGKSESCKPKVNVSNTCAFLNLQKGNKGGCEFHQSFGADNYGVTIVYPDLKGEFTRLFAYLKSLKNKDVLNNYRPSVGETVAVFVECTGTWSRAHVLVANDESYQVNLCDHGYVATVDTVCQLPQDLASIPEFGVQCHIINEFKPQVRKLVMDKKRFIFSVADVDFQQKKVICLLSAENEEVCKAEFTEWVPVLEEKNIPRCISLKNNDRVVLTVFFDLNSLCLRPLSQSNEMLLKLQEDLRRHCSLAPEIKEIPPKNEIVGCKFLIDGQFYRAQILDTEKDQIKILYIDYGNMDCVAKSRLRHLTTDLKKIPSLIVKVSLRNIVNNPMTKEAIDLLTGLSQNEEEMKIMIPESLEDGVELILQNGKKLNDEINKFLAPDTLKKLPEKEICESKVLTESDIKYLELPVEKTVDLVVLHKMGSEAVMGFEMNAEIMVQLDKLSKEINKYCESTSEKAYFPKLSELCFAKFEDENWYRAMCIGEGSTATNNILFLDYGNMAFVEHVNIRKMLPEYIEMPAVAVLCTLQVPTGLTVETNKQIDELVKVNEVYKAWIVSCDGFGSYVIEFPHVTEALT